VRLAIATIGVSELLNSSLFAVVVLHDIYDANSGSGTASGVNADDDTSSQILAGYSSHLALSLSNKSYLAAGVTNEGCTFTWIGNNGGNAFFLGAAHCTAEPTTSEFTFTTHDNIDFNAPVNGWTRIQHPNYGGIGSNEFDAVVYRVNGQTININDGMGGTLTQPTLYSGTDESNRVVTWVGYGTRGTGTTGQMDGINAHPATGTMPDWESSRAAGQNLIDGTVSTTVRYAIFEFDFDNPANAVSSFEGHLSSGDSGGPGFIDIGGSTVLAGIVSRSTDERYTQDDPSFGQNTMTRVSGIQSWLSTAAPGVSFAAIPEPSGFMLLGLVGMLWQGVRCYRWSTDRATSAS